MQDLTIVLVQTHLEWEDIDANLNLMDTRINDLGDPTDLIVLPVLLRCVVRLALAMGCLRYGIGLGSSLNRSGRRCVRRRKADRYHSTATARTHSPFRPRCGTQWRRIA